MFWLYSFILVFSTAIVTFAALVAALRLLVHSPLQDVPNERSNHQTPVPRGGGIAIVLALGLFFIVAGTPGLMLWAMLGVAIISLVDDWIGVAIRYRLIVHVAAACLAMMAVHSLVFQGLLPPLVDHLFAALLLAGWMNLYNFMDGIDGISGVESISLGLGLAAVAASVPDIPNSLGVDGLLLATACAVFLYFNWHPAKIFLGDVGSVPLGLITGFFLLQTANYGFWGSALILPAYYLVDGGYTLVKRLIKKEKIWEAHSQHAYQIAVRAGNSHAAVVCWILAGNLILIPLAVIATRQGYEIIALVLAYAVAAALRWKLTVLRPEPKVTILPPETLLNPAS